MPVRDTGTQRPEDATKNSGLVLPEDTEKAVAQLAAAHQRVRDEVGKVIIGQAEVIEQN